MAATSAMGGCILLANHMRFHKSYRPILQDNYDFELQKRDEWVKLKNHEYFERRMEEMKAESKAKDAALS